MLGGKPAGTGGIKNTEDIKNTEGIKKKWDERSKTYDEWEETFEGRVSRYVDWELLKVHLPGDKSAKILDAAGGTEVITLPLVKMGYTVTLCDISSGMLNVAKQKLLREGLLDKVKIIECDICDLPFAGESFDFVLCWGGTAELIKELIRATKMGGGVSFTVEGKCWASVNEFPKEPELALNLIKSGVNDERKSGLETYNTEELKDLFERNGVETIAIYGTRGFIGHLVPQEALTAREWDEQLFKQVAEMALGLGKEPSVVGIARRLVLYGKKIRISNSA